MSPAGVFPWSRRPWPGIVVLLAGLLLLGYAMWREQRVSSINTEGESQRAARVVSRVLQQKRAEARKLATAPGLDTVKDFHQSEFYRRLKHSHFDAFVYHGDSLEWWTSSQVSFDQELTDTGHTVIRHKSSWYQLSSFQLSGDRKLYLVYTIYRGYPVFNRNFKPYVNADFRLDDEAEFYDPMDRVKGSVPIKTGGGTILARIRVTDTRGDSLLKWYYLISVVLIFFGLFVLLYRTAKRYNLVFWATAAGVAVLLRLLLFGKVLLSSQDDIGLFSPEVYASSWYFPSLGDMLLHELTAMLLLFLAVRLRWRYATSWKSPLPKLWPMLGTAVYVLLLNFVFAEIAKLVTDSHIGFNFYEIDEITIYTFSGLLAVLLSFQVLRQLRLLLLPESSSLSVWIGVLIAAILNASLYLIYGNNALILATAFAFGTFNLLAPLFLQNRNRLLQYSARIVLACLSVATIFVHFQNTKEVELRKVLAARILYRNEVEPMNQLLRIEGLISKDNGITDYFTCKDISKSSFVQRLKTLYFSKGLNDFDLVVLDFDTLGRPYMEPNPVDYETVQRYYSGQFCQPVSLYFSQLSAPKLRGSYIGQFIPKTGSKKHGSLFLLLKPRFSSQPGKYEDIFGSSIGELSKENQYSYAIYENGHLNRRLGSFGYSLDLPRFTNESFRNSEGYSHYYLGDDSGSAVILSKKQNLFRHFLTNFTFLLVICIFAALLVLGLLNLIKLIAEKWEQHTFFMSLNQLLLRKFDFLDTRNLFLSSKIQFSMVAVVFITFIITVNVTINYIRNNYHQRQTEFLWNKLYGITGSISNESNLNDLFSAYRYGLIFDLSEHYGIDINIYSLNGKLLHTSNEKIFEDGFTGVLMDPSAYHELVELRKSEFFQTEKIGELSFLSAYHALLDNDLRVIGYLHLPYFAKTQDLNREIASYIVALVNLFAFVFAISALVAWFLSSRISAPLNLIRRNIGVLKLGGSNIHIPWKNNDEIGQLIHEYNRMIDQLEISTNKLAETEREGAWREMAKQVAHEIKNPLTPMKLSLQHLQNAMMKNDPDLQEKVKRTSVLLINQIDALSRMAEEFSSFAKMPETRMGDLDIVQVLDHCCTLFSQETSCAIEKDIRTDKAWVKADKDQLERVFTNIIKNAFQAIPEGREGKLSVSLYREDGYWTAAFEDNGKGIEQELWDKIFSPNFSTKNSGMGLGLAISRRIVESFGGQLSFTTRLGEGTTFFVRIPVRD